MLWSSSACRPVRSVHGGEWRTVAQKSDKSRQGQNPSKPDIQGERGTKHVPERKPTIHDYRFTLPAQHTQQVLCDDKTDEKRENRNNSTCWADLSLDLSLLTCASSIHVSIIVNTICLHPPYGTHQVSMYPLLLTLFAFTLLTGHIKYPCIHYC